MKNFKDIMAEANGKKGNKVEVTLTNEGHDFYVDYITTAAKGPNSILNIEKKMARIVKTLEKELPGGTWGFNVAYA